MVGQCDCVGDSLLSTTLTRSRSDGDELRFVFTGRSIVYRYATGPDAGIAEAVIDGTPAASIDQYTPQPGYAGRRKFDGLASGVHAIAIRVTGTRNPAAREATISVDGFEVGK